jgi:N-acetylglucosamine kinase-like BadF-type ATPase
MSQVIAVDGGNSKTDLAIIGIDGTVQARVRGPGCSPHALGVAGSIEVIARLLDQARPLADAPSPVTPTAAVGAFFLAGLDEPHEEAEYAAGIAATGWVDQVLATNDTFAVLRAGTTRDWGVAVVCGAGMNACAVHPDGRHGRYQALGTISGDWGGGEDVGIAALGASIRGNDLRGAPTALSRLVPQQLGYDRAEDVADAVHKGRLPTSALADLPPVVMAASRDGDAVAQQIVDRLADEVVAMSTALLRRLDLTDADPDVVLGGGLLQSGDERLISRIRNGVRDVVGDARVNALTAPPLLGSIRAALVRAGAPPSALERAAQELPSAGPPR